MDTDDLIRLNVTISREKDPLLYQLLQNINQRARARRVLNLATLGIPIENAGPNTLSNLLNQNKPMEGVTTKFVEDAQPMKLTEETSKEMPKEKASINLDEISLLS